MTKEQFEILLKAKNIMEEQVNAAIEYLQSMSVDSNVSNLYKLYFIALNNSNKKIRGLLIKELTKYINLVQFKESKALILLAQATDLVIKEEYNEAIKLYYDYKRLDCVDAKLDYYFDTVIFDILFENHVTMRYEKFVELLVHNPYLYEIDKYFTIRFFYKCAIVNVRTYNKKELKKNICEIKKIINTNRMSDFSTRIEQVLELTEIINANLDAKNDKEKEAVIDRYKRIPQLYFDYEYYINENIDAHLTIIKAIINHKDFKFAISILLKILSYDLSYKVKISVLKLLSNCYKEVDNNKYIDTIVSLNNLLNKYVSKYKVAINEGLLNAIKLYDAEKGLAEIQKLYEIDNLTHTFSRNVFYKKTFELFSQNNKGSILFFDLNNLKETNDKFSHSMGDEFLKTFANGVMKTVNKENFQLFRYGGDEFILTSSVTSISELTKVMDAIVKHFSHPSEILSESIQIKFSVGIALFPKNGSTIEKVISCADEAMYHAKKSGGGYKFYGI